MRKIYFVNNTAFSSLKKALKEMSLLINKPLTDKTIINSVKGYFIDEREVSLEEYNSFYEKHCIPYSSRLTDDGYTLGFNPTNYEIIVKTVY